MTSSYGLDGLAGGVGGLYERGGDNSSSIKGWEFLSNRTTVSFSDITLFCKAQRHVLLNITIKFSFSYETETTDRFWRWITLGAL
jgi:hypothetical protein